MEQQQMEAIRSKQNESLQRKAIQKRMASKQAREHEFSILQTDDSTDDEGKMNKRRPLPPAWSKGKWSHMISMGPWLMTNFFPKELKNACKSNSSRSRVLHSLIHFSHRNRRQLI